MEIHQNTNHRTAVEPSSLYVSTQRDRNHLLKRHTHISVGDFTTQMSKTWSRCNSPLTMNQGTMNSFTYKTEYIIQPWKTCSVFQNRRNGPGEWHYTQETPAQNDNATRHHLYEKSKTARHKGLPAWLPPVILGGEQQTLTNLTRSSISVRRIRASAELYAVINCSAHSEVAAPWYDANSSPKCSLVRER